MGIDIGKSLKSAANFMTPGVGAIHQNNGKPPIGAAPGIGTASSGAKFEQGLASKGSSMFGMNIGAISADSYDDNKFSLPGLGKYIPEEQLQGLAAQETPPVATGTITIAGDGVNGINNTPYRFNEWYYNNRY